MTAQTASATGVTAADASSRRDIAVHGRSLAATLPGPPLFAGNVALASITEVAGVVTMTFAAPPAFATARAGQFLLAGSNRDGAPLLPRPMSILATDPLTIAFGWQGEGTRLLSAAIPGEPIHLFGPLGHPFAALPAGTLLVAEGAHFGTLLALASELSAAGRTTEVLFITRPDSAAAGPVSAGEQDRALMAMFAPVATVTPVSRADLVGALSARSPAAIVAGASDAAMAVIQRHAEERKVPGQAALQVAMPCGIGACQSCIRKMRDGAYRLVCKGPVFPLDEPAFA